MKRATATAALLLMAASPGLAHQGGHHKSVKGIVQSMDEREVVVRTTEGKEQTILLDKDTQCRERRNDATCSDVKKGDRVVVVTRNDKEGKAIADKITFSHVGEEQKNGK